MNFACDSGFDKRNIAALIQLSAYKKACGRLTISLYVSLHTACLCIELFELAHVHLF